MGRQSCLEPEKWLGRQRRKSSYQGPYRVVRKMVIGVFSLTEAGEQQIGWDPETGPSNYG